MRALRALAIAAALAGCTSAARAAPGKPPEKTRSVDGAAGKLRVSDGGAGGVPVVFVHDVGSELEAWRAQLDHLRPQRRAIAYDQRGHGKSDRSKDGAYTIAALADDLDRVARALGLERFYLVGHGLAGAVLTTYAAAHPDKVAGLAYADAVGDFHAIPRQRIDAMKMRYEPSFGAGELKSEMSGMLSVGAKPETKKRVLAALDRVDPKAYAALRRNLADFSAADLLAGYTGPRLAIEADGPERSPAIFSALDKGASRVGVKGVSHWLMMDDPAAFDRALDPFVGVKPRD